MSDRIHNFQWLVDSGSAVSFLPESFHGQATTEGNLVNFIAANSTPITNFGELSLRIFPSCLSAEVSWRFCVANVAFPILGLDFLSHFSLVVDAARLAVFPSYLYDFKNQSTSTLTHTANIYSTGSETSSVAPTSSIDLNPPPSTYLSSPLDQYQQLLAEFPNLTSDAPLLSAPVHNVRHHIQLSNNIVFSAKTRRLSPEKLTFLSGHIQELLDLGVIRHSTSPYSSPAHLVPKLGGTFRLVGDYRKLNSLTIPDVYSIHQLHDSNSKLHGSSVFSKIDLKRAYHQIPMAEEDIPKTAISTPLGNYEYTTLPFGLRNAPATWCRFINEVLGGINFVHVYFDDILVFSRNAPEHVKHLKILFQRLSHFGLVINLNKCSFGQSEVDFLGHTINAQGISPQQAKVEAIRRMKLPEDQRTLRQFIGMASFYHNYINHFASTADPLYKLVTPGKATLKPVIFNEEARQAFNDLKESLANSTLLAHPVQNAETRIICDSSSIGLGAVLEQKQTNHWRPLAFCSRRLSSAERKYSVFSRELLAIFFAIKKFRYFVEGRTFHILTDHKPLVSAVKNTLDSYLPREQRQLEYISEFTTDIKHIQGSSNLVADALSRNCTIYTDIVANTIKFDDLAAEQFQSSDLLILQSCPNLNIQPIRLPSGNTMLADLSFDRIRPLVPETFRRPIFTYYHSFSHSGIRASQKIIAQRFLWPNMKKNIRDWTKECLSCQRHKTTRHTKSPLQPIHEPDQRFQMIHVDIAGPLPSTNDYCYLLCVIDRFSRWPEVYPLKDTSSETVISALTNNWLSRYGIPVSIASDNQSTFTSHNWNAFLELLGIKPIHTSPYHPQSNGIIERFIRTLKTALKAADIKDWLQNLPWVLLLLRASPKEDLDISPGEILYGQNLRLPGEFFNDQPIDASASLFAKQLKRHMDTTKYFFTKSWPTNTPFVSDNLRSADYVFVRDDSHSLTIKPAYKGPYKVLKRYAKYYILQDFSKNGVVSIDRLKPANVS